MARLAALACLLLLARPLEARAQERYAPLLRDLDRAGLLEELIARTVATQWGAVRAVVPQKRRAVLLDPLTEIADKTLARAESRALLGDLLDLHEKNLIVPQLDGLLLAFDAGRGAGENLAALSALAGAAAQTGTDKIAALAADLSEALDPQPLAAFAAAGAALPRPTWEALDRIALQTLEAGALEKASGFLKTGPAPARGLEPVRAALPGALCALEPEALAALSRGGDYLFAFIDTQPEPRVLVSLAQWFLSQLADEESQRFLSASLAYERLPQLAAAHRTAIAKGVLKEVLLDYADFIAGADRRVRVDPELWKQMQKGASTPESEGALSGIDLVKLGALTLYTVHRLDDIPSAPRAGGGAQTLADELLDYTDYQLEVQGRSSTFSPLFDAVREFLLPRPEREVLLAVTRRFAAHVMGNDPQALLASVDALLRCDPEMGGARAAAQLLDEKSENGDARALARVLLPAAHAPSGPLVPLVSTASRTRKDAVVLAPALRVALSHEQKAWTLSRFAVGAGATLVKLDPLARALASKAPLWRLGLEEASEERLMRSLAWSRAFLGNKTKKRFDSARALDALAGWEALPSPLSGRSLLADLGVAGTEALRAELPRTILDAGAALRRDDPRRGLERLLDALRAALAPPTNSKRVGMP